MSLFMYVSEQAGRIKTFRQSVAIQALSLAFLFVLLSSLSLKAATLPAGFTETQVVAGLSSPTAMAFAPDGRLFVTQQGGQLRVIKNGTLLPTPFLTVPVDSTGERGLLGIAFDPNFTTNQFIYVYYTSTTPATHNRVSRFTANGDVAVAGSEVVILDLNNLSSANNHNGGALHFGPDGKLYIATGENALPLNSQTLNNLLGKILRINSDGTIPTDNPFFNIAAGVNRAIWVLGLRNPYTFAFQPGTSRMFINDVGQNAWEEINDGIAGSNYGWPNSEGATTNPNYRTPLFSYPHGGPVSTAGCAITGGTFYNPQFSQYPGQFVGKYFFADFCNGWIRLLDPSNNTASDFASGIASPVDLQVGPDGLLYYLARGSGAIFRINFPANQPPTISTQPTSQSVTEGQPATFSVTASGSAPLNYQWQRNNVDITNANSASYTLPSALPSDNGAKFKVVVTNAFGSVTSNEATLTVTAAPTTLTMTNSASFRGDGTRGGLASIQGTGLTGGLSGNSESEANVHRLRVNINGRTDGIVLSYNDSQINIYILQATLSGLNHVQVSVNLQTTAAGYVFISNDNPGLFTTTQTGAGEAIALQVSGMRYTRSPFDAQTDGQATVIALFGTGWRRSLPVSVTIGGKEAVVEFAGTAVGFFNGLDQINVRIPDGVTGQSPVVVRTASGAVSRSDVFVTIR